MAAYPNHDWRADEFSMIRGEYHAAVSRAWCATSTASDPWRWLVWRIDKNGSLENVADEDDVARRGNFSFAGAIAAAEKFIDERIAEEKLGNVFAFEGAPAPAEVCF